MVYFANRQTLMIVKVKAKNVTQRSEYELEMTAEKDRIFMGNFQV